MEAINSQEKSQVRLNTARPAVASSSMVSSDKDPSTQVSLTDLSSLVDRIKSSSDIRPDAVERGKSLLADPNWPSDDIIDSLAEKLLDEEGL